MIKSYLHTLHNPHNHVSCLILSVSCISCLKGKIVKSDGEVHRTSVYFSGFHWSSLDFTEIHWWSQNLPTEYHWIPSNFHWFHWFPQNFPAEDHWTPSDFTDFTELLRTSVVISDKGVDFTKPKLLWTKKYFLLFTVT